MSKKSSVLTAGPGSLVLDAVTGKKILKIGVDAALLPYVRNATRYSITEFLSVVQALPSYAALSNEQKAVTDRTIQNYTSFALKRNYHESSEILLMLSDTSWAANIPPILIGAVLRNDLWALPGAKTDGLPWITPILDTAISVPTLKYGAPRLISTGVRFFNTGDDNYDATKQYQIITDYTLDQVINSILRRRSAHVLWSEGSSNDNYYPYHASKRVISQLSSAYWDFARTLLGVLSNGPDIYHIQQP